MTEMDAVEKAKTELAQFWREQGDYLQNMARVTSILLRGQESREVQGVFANLAKRMHARAEWLSTWDVTDRATLQAFKDDIESELAEHSSSLQPLIHELSLQMYMQSAHHPKLKQLEDEIDAMDGSMKDMVFRYHQYMDTTTLSPDQRRHNATVAIKAKAAIARVCEGLDTATAIDYRMQREEGTMTQKQMDNYLRVSREQNAKQKQSLNKIADHLAAATCPSQVQTAEFFLTSSMNNSAQLLKDLREEFDTQMSQSDTPKPFLVYAHANEFVGEIDALLIGIRKFNDQMRYVERGARNPGA